MKIVCSLALVIFSWQVLRSTTSQGVCVEQLARLPSAAYSTEHAADLMPMIFQLELSIQNQLVPTLDLCLIYEFFSETKRRLITKTIDVYNQVLESEFNKLSKVVLYKQWYKSKKKLYLLHIFKLCVLQFSGSLLCIQYVQ